MNNLHTSAHAPSLNLDLLLDYLEGKLSDEEVNRVDAILQDEPEWIDVLENLEAGLKQDPNLRENLSGMTRAVSEAAFEASAHQSSQQDPVPTAHQPEATVIRRPFWKQPMLRMAAMIALIALPAAWILLQPQGTLYEQMSEQYLQPFAVSEVIRSGPSAADILDHSLGLYQRGDYAQAAHDLAAIADSGDLTADEQLTARMYLGLSYLFSGNADEASTELEAVVNMGVSPFLEPAQWYLAWSYWKTGETSKAKTAFEDIARVPGLNQKHAQEILDKWEA